MIPAWFRAFPFECRFRLAWLIVVLAIGFTAPWDRWLHLDGIGGSVWLLSSAYLTRAFGMSLEAASVAMLAWGILLSLLAALLSTWAAAYPEAMTISPGALKAQALPPSSGPFQYEQVVSPGPYRRMRNPFHAGTFLLVLALAILMPPSGAVFTIILTAVLLIRLIGAEEASFERGLGPAYAAYVSSVPSLVPRLRPSFPVVETRLQWPRAFVSELFLWGVVAAFSIAGWRYNAFLVTRWVVVSFGVSLVARAAMPISGNHGAAAPAKN